MSKPGEEAWRRTPDALTALGVRSVVNCMGTYTDLGGSILAPEVWAALEELNRTYVYMPDLIEAAGTRIARIAGAEAGRVVPGASAGLALSVGATMTGMVGKYWEQLPDTTGLKNEALMPAAHLPHYQYANTGRMSGAKLVPAGSNTVYDQQGLIDAVSSRTACILVAAHLLDAFEGVEKLRSLCQAAHEKGVPVVVDAAYMIDPPERLLQYGGSGADLMCYSAKYFYGPNSGGFIIGRKSLIDAVAGLDFTRFASGPFRKYGRAFKMNRYDVLATVLALEAWMKMDHQSRWQNYAATARRMAANLPEVPGVEIRPLLFNFSEELVESDLPNCVALRFAGGKAARQRVIDGLEGQDPMIVGVQLDDELIICVEVLQQGQEQFVVEHLTQALLA